MKSIKTPKILYNTKLNHRFDRNLKKIGNSDDGIKNKKNKGFFKKFLSPAAIKLLKKKWLKRRREFARFKASILRVKRCQNKYFRINKKRYKRRKLVFYEYQHLETLLARKMKTKEFYPKIVTKLFKKIHSKRTPIEIKWLYTVRSAYFWDNSKNFNENLKCIRNNLSFKWYLYKLRSPRFLTAHERIRSGYYFKDGRFTLPTTFNHKNKRLPIRRKKNKRLRGFFTFCNAILGGQSRNNDMNHGSFDEIMSIRKANSQLNLDPYAPVADQFDISSKFSIKNAFDLNQISFFNDKNKYFNEKQTWGFNIKTHRIPRTFFYNLCASFFFRKFFGFSNYKKLKNHRFSFSGKPKALSSFMKTTNQRPVFFLMSRGWFNSKYTFKYLYGMGNVLWFPGSPTSSYFRRSTFWKNQGPTNRYDRFYSIGDVFGLTPINLIYNNFKLTMSNYYKKRFNSKNVGRFRRNYWLAQPKKLFLPKKERLYGSERNVSFGSFKNMVKKAREHLNKNLYKRKFKHPGLYNLKTHPKRLYPKHFKSFTNIYKQSLNGNRLTYGLMFEPKIRRRKSPKFTKNRLSQFDHPLQKSRRWRYSTFKRRSLIKDYYIGNFSSNFFKKKNPSFGFYSSFFKNKTRFFGMRSLLTNPSLFKTKALFLSKLDHNFRGIKHTLLSYYTGMRFDLISFLFTFYIKSPIFKYFINEVIYGTNGAWHILENITKHQVDYSLYLDFFGLSVIKHWYTFIQSFISGGEADLYVDVSQEKSIKFVEPTTNPALGFVTSGFFLDFITKDPLLVKGYIRKEQYNLYKNLKTRASITNSMSKQQFFKKSNNVTHEISTTDLGSMDTTYLLRNYFKKLDYTNFLNCYKYAKTLENLSNYLQQTGLVNNKGLLSKALSDKFLIDKTHRINHNMAQNVVPSKLSSTHTFSNLTYTKLSNRYIFKTNTNKFKRMSTFGKWFRFLFEQKTQAYSRLPTKLLNMGFPRVFKVDMLSIVGKRRGSTTYPAFTNFLKTTQRLDQAYIHATRSLYYKSLLDYFKNGKSKQNQFFFNDRFMFGDRIFRDFRKLQYMNHDYYYRHLVGTRAFSRFSRLGFKFDPYLNEVYNGYDFNTFEDLLPFYKNFNKWVLLKSNNKVSNYFFNKYFSKNSRLYKNKYQVGFSLRLRRGYQYFSEFFKKNKFMKTNWYTPKFSKVSTILYEHFFFKQFLNNKFRHSIRSTNFIKLKRRSMSHYIKNFWRKYFIKLIFIDKNKNDGITQNNTILPPTVNYEKYVNNLQNNYYQNYYTYLNGQLYDNLLRKLTTVPTTFFPKIITPHNVLNLDFNIFDNKKSLIIFNYEFFETGRLDFLRFFKNYFVSKNFYGFLIPVYTISIMVQKYFNFSLLELALNQIVYLLILIFQKTHNKQYNTVWHTR